MKLNIDFREQMIDFRAEMIEVLVAEVETRHNLWELGVLKLKKTCKNQFAKILFSMKTLNHRI